MGAASLVTRRSLPVLAWFVVPAIVQTGELWLLWRQGIPLWAGEVTLAGTLLLGVAAQHGLALLHPGWRGAPGFVWGRLRLPVAWLIAGSLATGWITSQQEGRPELGWLPMGVMLGAVVPCLLIAARSEDPRWHVARARVAGLYLAACLDGACWLLFRQWTELVTGSSGRRLDEVLVAWAVPQAALCVLVGLGVAGMTAGRYWRSMLPALAATCALLAPWVALDRSARARLQSSLPQIALPAGLQPPVGRDETGRWPHARLTLATISCQATYADGRWQMASRQVADCDEWLLVSDGALPVRELRPWLDAHQAIYLLVRGSGGPPFRRLRLNDPWNDRLRPSADWTVEDLVRACLSTPHFHESCGVASSW